MKQVYLQNYGCQMNEADSEEMLLHLASRGYILTQNLDHADLVLVNTCTIRDHAEHRALSYLGRLEKWKKAKKGRIIIFTGCAAERLGKSIKKRFPQTDIICGAKQIDNFDKILDESTLLKPKTYLPQQSTKQLTARVNIMRGCSCKCAYCIVPYVRGEAYSLPVDNILQQCEEKSKYSSELLLLGQTVNAYSYKGVSFACLLKKICEIPTIKRIRFLSPHPFFINDDFYKVLAENKQIARHLHLPVQSGSTKILTDMKRLYTREEFLTKVENLKQLGCLVSTDIIVGYPTETDEDFKDTLTLVKKCAFSFAYCFKFSPRATTPASFLPELPEKVLENRLNILLNEIREFSANAYKSCIGTKQEVLFETKNSGRTSNNLWYRCKEEYEIGSFAEVQILESDGKILK